MDQYRVQGFMDEEILRQVYCHVGAEEVAKLVQLALLMHSRAPVKVLAALTSRQLHADEPERQWKVAQGPGLLPHVWESSIEFPTSA